MIQSSNHEWKKKKGLRQLRAIYASFYYIICSFLKLAGVFRAFKVNSTTRLVPQTYNVPLNSTIIERVPWCVPNNIFTMVRRD